MIRLPQLLNASQMREREVKAALERPAFYSVSVVRWPPQHVGKLIEAICICVFVFVYLCICVFVYLCICVFDSWEYQF